MTQTHKELFNKIAGLPVEKLNIAMTFINFLEQQKESVLLIEPTEEEELRDILISGEFVGSSEIFAKIEAMPND